LDLSREGLLCVARLGDRRWSSRVPPARVSEARRLGNTQAITRCGELLQLHEPLQNHEPMQIQSWAGIFAQITPNGAPLQAHGVQWIVR
jgi:hypothetical protein